VRTTSSKDQQQAAVWISGEDQVRTSSEDQQLRAIDVIVFCGGIIKAAAS